MDAKGEQSCVQANRQNRSMSRVFRWSYQRGYVSENTCVVADNFSKPQPDHYIIDEEYFTIYEHASDQVEAAMEIASLCAAKVIDVLKVIWNQIIKNRIFIK